MKFISLAAPILLVSFFLSTYSSFGQIDTLTDFNQPIREKIGKKKGNDKKNKLIPLPVILYQPETSWQFGANVQYYFRSKKDTASSISLAGLKATYTLNKQFILNSNLSLFRGENSNLYSFVFNYKNFPEDFFGVGNNTERDSLEDFSYQNLEFVARYKRKLIPNFYVGIQYRFDLMFNPEFEEDSDLVHESFLGKDGHRTSGIGLNISYDTRDNILYPYEGGFASLSNYFYSKILGSEFRYQFFQIDLRKFFNPGGRHVIALQGLAEFNTGDVPFKELSKVGGTDLLRGFYEGRFIDKHLIAVQIEYRFPIVWHIRGNVFVSAGEVTDKISQYSIQGLNFAYGAGIRFFLDEKERITIRIDYGRSLHEGGGIYFKLNEAF